MIDVKYNEVKDRNSWIDGNYLNATICVTEDCNLRCTYCYMVGKNNVNRMNWEQERNYRFSVRQSIYVRKCRIVLCWISLAENRFWKWIL